MASLTDNEKVQLKDNCIAIKNYLENLVKDYPTDISINVKFYDRDKSYHENGIYIRRYNTDDGLKTKISGSSGALSIILDPNQEKTSSSTYAWTGIGSSYAIELITQWPSIKAEIISKYHKEIEDRKAVREFRV